MIFQHPMSGEADPRRSRSLRVITPILSGSELIALVTGNAQLMMDLPTIGSGIFPIMVIKPTADMA
jgi:hypothetical protein